LSSWPLFPWARSSAEVRALPRAGAFSHYGATYKIGEPRTGEGGALLWCHTETGRSGSRHARRQPRLRCSTSRVSIGVEGITGPLLDSARVTATLPISQYLVSWPSAARCRRSIRAAEAASVDSRTMKGCRAEGASLAQSRRVL